MIRRHIPFILLAFLLLPAQSWAVVSVVNQVIASTAGASSLTTGTFSATAGNTLVVLACSKGNISQAITTSGSDTPTTIDESATPAAGAAKLSYLQNIVGGASYTVTVTPGGGTPTLTLIVMELAGVPTTGVYDTYMVDNITPANTSHASGPTATLAQADEIAIGYLCSDSAVAATATKEASYTLSNSELAGATKAVGALSYKVVNVNTAVSHTWTTDSTTTRTGVATFKAGAAAASPRNLMMMGMGQ